MGVVVMMPLRIAKKIFNRVCAEEQRLVQNPHTWVHYFTSDDVELLKNASPEDRQEILHWQAVYNCGYTVDQSNRCLQRLYRSVTAYARKFVSSDQWQKAIFQAAWTGDAVFTTPTGHSYLLEVKTVPHA